MFSFGFELRWQEYESEHFNFRYLVDSPASKDITSISTRSESCRAIVVDTLDLECSPDEKMLIYLLDLPDGGAQLGSQQPQRPVLIPECHQIRIVYRTDAPGLGLEQAIARLLLI